MRSRMTRDELDIELLMLHLQRNFDASAFPHPHGVVAFIFSDLYGPRRRWWLVLERGQTELCLESPGRSEDVAFTCSVRTLCEVFAGDTTLARALAEGRMQAQGTKRLVRSAERWLRPSPFAGIETGP